MKLTNFLSPSNKLHLLEFGAISCLASLLYDGKDNITNLFTKNLVKALVTATAFSAFSRYIIDFKYEGSSIETPPEHKLNKLVNQLIENNDSFAGLENIEIFTYESNQLNAFACGFKGINPAIYVSTGLIKKFEYDESDRKLQAVLAHELGHVSNNHNLINSLYKNIKVIIYETDTFIISALGKHILKATSFLSRQMEYESDQMAAEAGLGLDLINVLEEITSNLKPVKDSVIFGINSYMSESDSSHPSLLNRAANIRAALKENNTEYDDLYDWFIDSLYHTYDRAVEEHLIHFSSHTELAGVINDLTNFQNENI